MASRVARTLFSPRFSRAEAYGMIILAGAITKGVEPIGALLLFMLWLLVCKMAEGLYGR